MKIGILGTSQLSRMLALSGIPMGFEFEFYSPQLESSVSSLGKVTIGEYDDWTQLNAFATRCDIVTYENDNVPFATLRELDEKTVIYPKANALQQSQDRLVEKIFLKLLNIPAVPFRAISNQAELLTFVKEFEFPIIVKTRKDSSDGQDHFKIESTQDIANLAIHDKEPLIVEKMINYIREISIIGVRSQSGETVFYDICENHHLNFVLQKTLNRKHDPRSPQAINYLKKIMNELNYFGAITLELFETESGLLANEFSARVHDSGLWTVEGTVCSQFTNHLRAIAGYRLGSTESHGLYEMTNVFDTIIEPLDVLNHPYQSFHDYQKSPKPGRKMGHIVKMLKKERFK